MLTYFNANFESFKWWKNKELLKISLVFSFIYTDDLTWVSFLIILLNKFILQTILKLYFNHASLFYFFYHKILLFGFLVKFSLSYEILQFCTNFYNHDRQSILKLYFNLIFPFMHLFPISFVKKKFLPPIKYPSFIQTFMIHNNHDWQQP
jgi:hypothetical protein